MPRAIPVADPIDVYIGQRLRALRIERRVSQSDLGAALNVTFQQIQKYERGDNRVSASMLMKAAEALGSPIAEFFPAEFSATSSQRSEIASVGGGGALSTYFLAMSPARRQILIQVAREFVGGSGQDEKA